MLDPKHHNQPTRPPPAPAAVLPLLPTHAVLWGITFQAASLGGLAQTPRKALLGPAIVGVLLSTCRILRAYARWRSRSLPLPRRRGGVVVIGGFASCSPICFIGRAARAEKPPRGIRPRARPRCAYGLRDAGATLSAQTLTVSKTPIFTPAPLPSWSRCGRSRVNMERPPPAACRDNVEPPRAVLAAPRRILGNSPRALVGAQNPDPQHTKHNNLLA